MTQASMPRSRMMASRACRSVASGVVRMESSRSSPMRVSTVPMSPVRCPRARSADSMRYAVVVLPLVPVTPSAMSPSAGCP